jgi:hypothetical protein
VGVPVGVFSVEPVRRGVLESLGELVRVPPSVTVTVGDAVEEGDAVEDAEAVTEVVAVVDTVAVTDTVDVPEPVITTVPVAQPVDVTEGVPDCSAEAEGATVPVAECESEAVPPPAAGASDSVGEVDTEAHAVGAPEGEGALLGVRLAPPVGDPRGEPVAASTPLADTHAEAVGDAAQQRVGEPVGEWLSVVLTVPRSVGLLV